jgi:branched-subunit amino acid permease
MGVPKIHKFVNNESCNFVASYLKLKGFDLKYFKWQVVTLESNFSKYILHNQIGSVLTPILGLLVIFLLDVSFKSPNGKYESTFDT